MKNALLFCFLFLYILSPTFSVIPIQSSVLVLLPLFALNFLKGGFLKLDRKILIILFFLLFFAFYAGLIKSILYEYSAESDEYVFSKMLANNFIYLIAGVSLGAAYKADDGFISIMKFTVFAVALNSFLIILSFFIVDFRDVLESIMAENAASNIDYSEGFRLRGLAAGGGFALAAMTIIGSICLVLINFRGKIGTKTSFLLFIVFIVSQIFVARTGLIFTFVIFSFWLLYSLLLGKQKKDIIFSISFFILVSFFVFSYLYSSFQEQLSKVLPWAFELFNNLLSGNGLHTKSSDDLMTMFNVPSDLFKIIFGFGFYESSVDFRSDSGYVKSLYSVGVFGVVIYLFHVFMMLIYLPKKFPNFSIFFYVLLFFVLLMEIKGPILYQNYTARFIFLLYGLSFSLCKNVAHEKSFPSYTFSR
ncbi:hypothetical protein [Marinomonas sp.]|uniref:hypothetical protein n=1 Tax=Marinomonas sp. TaxID=1904862 RepID=UPI003A9106C0